MLRPKIQNEPKQTVNSPGLCLLLYPSLDGLEGSHSLYSISWWLQLISVLISCKNGLHRHTHVWPVIPPCPEHSQFGTSNRWTSTAPALPPLPTHIPPKTSRAGDQRSRRKGKEKREETVFSQNSQLNLILRYPLADGDSCAALGNADLFSN